MVPNDERVALGLLVLEPDLLLAWGRHVQVQVVGPPLLRVVPHEGDGHGTLHLGTARLGLAEAPVQHLILPGLGRAAGGGGAPLAPVFELHARLLPELLLEELDRAVLAHGPLHLQLPSRSVPAPMLHEPILALVLGLDHLKGALFQMGNPLFFQFRVWGLGFGV